jgi:hypothetical protein
VAAAWALWPIFLLWVSYETRFWINNDTIGSLDCARQLRTLALERAVNPYWGFGFAFLLSLLPLEGAGSWLQIHLLTGLLVIGGQVFLYLALTRLRIRSSLAGALSLAWGASNYASGGALFLTSDPLLGFLGSIYLFLFIKSAPEIFAPKKAWPLGLVHALAALTKTAAFFTLFFLPLVLSVQELLRGGPGSSLKNRAVRLATFNLFYLLPIFIIFSLWGAAVTAKYERFALWEAGIYNYARYVRGSENLALAEDLARHQVPRDGTYWWSDIAGSLSGWDHRAYFDRRDQVACLKRNLTYIWFGPGLACGAALLALLLVSWLGSPLLAKQGEGSREIALITASAALGIFLTYSLVHLLPRFLPFAAIFALPGCGLLLERVFRGRQKFGKILSVTFLSLAILHGVGAMAYASLMLAPGGEHFALAREISARKIPGKAPGPLGAFLASDGFMYHHAVLAYLLRLRTGEIRPASPDGCRYTATFRPHLVLLVFPAGDPAPVKIEVDARTFERVSSCIWGKRDRRTLLAVYQDN